MIRTYMGVTAGRQGFTLMELMIIIVVIGMLVAVGLPRFTSFMEEGRESATLQQMDGIKAAVNLYFMHTKTYPEGIADLINQPSGESVSNWKGPYMDGKAEDIENDGWGHPMGFYYLGKTGGEDNGIIIVSGGPEEVEVSEGADFTGEVGASKVIWRYIRYDGKNFKPPKVGGGKDGEDLYTPIESITTTTEEGSGG